MAVLATGIGRAVSAVPDRVLRWRESGGRRYSGIPCTSTIGLARSLGAGLGHGGYPIDNDDRRRSRAVQYDLLVERKRQIGF